VRLTHRPLGLSQQRRSAAGKSEAQTDQPRGERTERFHDVPSQVPVQDAPDHRARCRGTGQAGLALTYLPICCPLGTD
jgi:hypothetical protein